MSSCRRPALMLVLCLSSLRHVLGAGSGRDNGARAVATLYVGTDALTGAVQAGCYGQVVDGVTAECAAAGGPAVLREKW